MQKSNTLNLIFRIPYLIGYLSQTMTLLPGDILSTGTPGGVGVFRNPQVFLKAGDTVAVTIAGLGTLTNSTRARLTRTGMHKENSVNRLPLCLH